MSFPVRPGPDDNKDADSLLDETVANSNQNNSNCSSPSRMSDSVSLTTDSSQDNSLCTPERETKIPLIPKNRYIHTPHHHHHLHHDMTQAVYSCRCERVSKMISDEHGQALTSRRAHRSLRLCHDDQQVVSSDPSATSE